MLSSFRRASLSYVRLSGATLLAALTLAFFLAPVAAQQGQQPPPVNPRNVPPPPPAPPQGGKNVIRRTTDLVLIDVQVLDKSGKPVKGLKLDQFSVYEDDKPQKVSSFDYYDIEAIETAAAEDVRPVMISLGAVASPDVVREQVRDRRLIVLYFDLTSLQPDELQRSVRAADKFLKEQMTPADLVALVTFGNQLRAAVGFTNDRVMLQRAVARLVPGGETQLAGLADAAAASSLDTTVQEDTGAAFTADDTEFNIFNTDRKLAALQSLCALLRDIPGRKSVIQFTGGITQTGDENRSQLRAATDAANRANASLYTVDSRGLMAAVPGGDASVGAASGTAMFSGAAVFSQVQSRQDSRETLATLASDTGGQTFTDLGDLSQVFSKVQADAGGYYLLGYYPANLKQDGKWRRLNVKVNMPGVKVRFREGYYAPKDFGIWTTEDRERQLEDAMRSETPRVELPIALETAHFRLSKNEVFVPIAAKLASSALQWAQKRGRREVEFDFAAEVREANTNHVAGALRDTVKVKLEEEKFKQLQQAIVYQGGMVLGPGEYKLKFLARENETGRVGTFEEKITLPSPTSPERLELSSVLLSSQLVAVQKSSEVEKKALGVDARLKTTPLEMGGERIIPSVTRVFTAQQELYIFFQAYYPPKEDAANLRAGLVFFRSGERSNETPLVEPAEVDAKTHTASFRIALPLEKLVAGRYTVQAVVVEAGGAQAAFARAYFALRPATQPAKAAASGGQ